MNLLTGLAFIVAGVFHFLRPQTFVRIVPPFIPAPLAMVYISGVAEILLGVGLFLPDTRRLAGYGLAALLVAVFPANIYMALANIQPPGVVIAPWILWARLPLQAVFFWWVLWVSKRA